MTTDAGGLRDRKRLAVQQHMAEVAEQLFLERGYDATTIDDIAAECGMSTRTAYRYFATKDDILVSHFNGSAVLLVSALQARPAAEPAWVSLHAAFETLTWHVDTRPDRAAARRLHHVIFSTSNLLGRYLQRLHEAQREITELLHTRAGNDGNVSSVDEVVLAATVGAAFACFVAAQETWSRHDGTLSLRSVVQRAMEGLTSPTTPTS